ncbi:dienelactone hydrolase family protein [Roseibium sp.]|uniref:dienelactone hydrolase family protein n=1 Tax=Roseibium sp. TaxID=1936156 RepID=UPI003B52E654
MGLKVLLAAATLTFSNTVFAWGVELSENKLVAFELPVAPATSLQQLRQDTSVRNLPQGTLSGRLRVPAADRKLPAVVVVHTCHGEKAYEPWLDRLNTWGYATLSFSRCQPPDHSPDDAHYPSLDWKRGALAALGALRHLAERDDIDAASIAIMGWSRLGMIPLSVLNPEGFYQFFPEKFAAAVALYPFCSFARGPHAGPILVISAAQDDYVDAAVCERMAGETSRDDFPIRSALISNAYHGFDLELFGAVHDASRDEINPDGFAAGGGSLGYDEAGQQTAIALVRAFLQEHVPSQKAD